MFNSHGDGPKLRRICKNGLDNNLLFYPSTDTCSLFNKYYIWAKDGSSSPFILLDSLSNKTDDAYNHIGANPIGNPKTWTYFITYTDSCTPTGLVYSDTLEVDEIAPDSVFIDSVSVDPLLNQIIIGWKGSKSKDFLRYIVFKDSSSNIIPISPANFRDTSLYDTRASSNPQNQVLTYDITAMDSCFITQVFGYNPHSSILLQSSVDSCKSTATLSWSPYIGWPGIRTYYIYSRRDLNPEILLDSVQGNINTYTFSIILGSTYGIFIRAFKDGSELISSRSNQTSFSTRFRTDPNATYLANISAVNPDGNQLEVLVTVLPNEEYASLVPFHSDEDLYPAFSAMASLSISGTSRTFTYTVNETNKVQLFRVSGTNLCLELTDTSNLAGNIVLSTTGNGTENLIYWNKYFGWDNGVELYRVYRGTNLLTNTVDYSLLGLVPGFDSVYIDANPLQDVGNLGVCYYIEAVQNDISPHGLKSISKSFSSCVSGDMVVFVPNAFVPEGVNKIFRPEGSYIDYENSTMEIYNRWGAKVISYEKIVPGWDGKSSSGIDLESGVYLYQMKIKSTNGKEQIKKGTVTLLR